MIMAASFASVVATAVAEGREIVADGQTDYATPADVAAADDILAGAARTYDRVNALARVAGLGAEYLAAVGREPDVVAQLGPNPEGAVRHWYLTMGG
jgi:hypothetical protein